MPRVARATLPRLGPRGVPALLALTLLFAFVPVASAHPHKNAPPVDVTLRIQGAEVTVLVDLEKWQILSWGRRATPMIDLAASLTGEEALRRVSQRLEVALDGVVVAPVLRGYIEAPIIEEDLQPRVKLSVAYPTSAAPTRVRVLWKDFTGIHWETEQQVPLLVAVGPELDTTTLTKKEPEYIWHTRPPAGWRSVAAPPPPAPPAGQVPLAAVVLGLLAVALPFVGPLRRRGPVARWVPSAVALSGTALALVLGVGRVEAPWGRPLPPSEAQAKSVFVGLVKNVYLAFEAKTEREIYDLLAASVDRSLLDGLYGDVYESLVMRDAGGAVAHVKDFVPGEVAVRFPANGSTTQFDVDGAWTVTGAVTHWGHTHTRTIVYRAQATVRNEGGGWRISAITMLEHERTDDGTSGTGGTPAPADAAPSEKPSAPGEGNGGAADPPR
jgi:hypothetical protein